MKAQDHEQAFVKKLNLLGKLLLLTVILAYPMTGYSLTAMYKEHSCFTDHPYEKQTFSAPHPRQGLKWNLTRWVPDPPEVPSPNSRGVVITYSLVLTGDGSFHIDLNDDDFIGSETKDIIRQATESWNHVCGVTLKEVSEGGDIQIGASTGGVGTAHTTSYQNTTSKKWYIVRSFIQLGTSKPWTREKLLLVVSHEVGHALGLGHTNLSDALMWPTTGSGQQAPTGDERWYSQALYGPALSKLNYDFSISAPVTLNLTKTCPIQTGTTSSPTYSGSPGEPGTGTGALTQDDVSHYVLERKAPGEDDFSIIADALTPEDNQANADPLLTHSENQFNYIDSDFPTDGIYTYRLMPVHISNGNDQYSDELKVKISLSGTPNQAPIFKSSPTPSMSPAIVNYAVLFSADVSDPDEGESVTLTWDWGDGSGPSTGTDPEHRFTQTGSYTITVTASDEYGANTTSSITLQVDALGEGSGDNDEDGIIDSEDDDDDNDGIPDSEDNDLDGDGFDNSTELQLGTSPNDKKSSPFTPTRLIGTVLHGKVDKDKCMLQGKLTNLPADFSPAGLTATINIGGVTREFTLTAKGQGKLKTGQLRVNIKKIKKSGYAPFRFIAKGTFADNWADEGLDTTADPTGTFMTIKISIRIGSYTYMAVLYPQVTGKANKRIRFFYKLPKQPKLPSG